MLAKVNTATSIGLEAVAIDVEVDVANRGLPSLSIVGLPDKAVEEARDRVRTALHNSGIDFPPKKITINLAPADIPKEGPSYDLPIAVGILIAIGEFDAKVDDSLFLGEVSLDGSVRHCAGVLPIVMTAKKNGIKHIFVPESNAREAAIIKDVTVYPVKNIKQLVAHLTQTIPIIPQTPTEFSARVRIKDSDIDICDVHGQEFAKRALEIAAAGGHNVIFNGSPGSGKTMLARAFATILPSLTEEEALEVTKIYSIANALQPGESIMTQRPFRSPHHTTSRIGLIGGGSRPKPGEISLAHRGVLFLDEFPEFPRNVIESLRQPMEDGIVQISRASGSAYYPCQFTLIAAANPCPCGYYLSKKRECTCLAGSISRYQKKISGPLLDRIDLHVTVSEVEVDKLGGNDTTSEKSAVVRDRVEKAREIQKKRYLGTKINTNCELTTKQVKDFAPIGQAGKEILLQAVSKLGLSARSYFKLIKISRTIADLDNSPEIEVKHIAESLQFRPLMRS